jgi:hypothetical protein
MSCVRIISIFLGCPLYRKNLSPARLSFKLKLVVLQFNDENPFQPGIRGPRLNQCYC